MNIPYSRPNFLRKDADSQKQPIGSDKNIYHDNYAIFQNSKYDVLLIAERRRLLLCLLVKNNRGGALVPLSVQLLHC